MCPLVNMAFKARLIACLIASEIAPSGSVTHTGLTRVSSIRFLLFEIKRILVFNSIIIYFTDLFMFYIFIQNAYANKKVFNKKGYQIMFNGSKVTAFWNIDRTVKST